MIRFQLDIAVVLAASVLGSVIVSYWTRTQEGKIQLPIHVDESLGSSDGRDPLDVTTPDDIIDGYPIDEEQFWREARLLSLSLVQLSRLNCEKLSGLLQETDSDGERGLHCRSKHSLSRLRFCQCRARLRSNLFGLCRFCNIPPPHMWTVLDAKFYG